MRHGPGTALIAITAAVLLGSMPAAATTSIATSAFALDSNVTGTVTGGTTQAPVAPVSGSTAPGYTQFSNLPGFSRIIDFGSVGAVQTLLSITTGAISSGNGANGTTPQDTTAGWASSDVRNLTLSLYTLEGGTQTNLLDLSLARLFTQSSASRSGNATSLTALSSLSTGQVSVNGSQVISFGNNTRYAANFVAHDVDGLRILFNAQDGGGSFGSPQQLAVSSIYISFTNFIVGGQTLNGDIRIGQADVDMLALPPEPVPEPASWVQLLGGFGVIGLAGRRRYRLGKRPARALS
jgi:hypothetical protein